MSGHNAPIIICLLQVFMDQFFSLVNGTFPKVNFKWAYWTTPVLITGIQCHASHHNSRFSHSVSLIHIKKVLRKMGSLPGNNCTADEHFQQTTERFSRVCVDTREGVIELRPTRYAPHRGPNVSQLSRFKWQNLWAIEQIYAMKLSIA